MQHHDTIKYTAVLPASQVQSLKEMASRKEIPSVNYGIRQALEQYLENEKRARYEREMQMAAQDNEFMTRTMGAQAAFAELDEEEMREW